MKILGDFLFAQDYIPLPDYLVAAPIQIGQLACHAPGLSFVYLFFECSFLVADNYLRKKSKTKCQVIFAASTMFLGLWGAFFVIFR